MRFDQTASRFSDDQKLMCGVMKLVGSSVSGDWSFCRPILVLFHYILRDKPNVVAALQFAKFYEWIKAWRIKKATTQDPRVM